MKTPQEVDRFWRKEGVIVLSSILPYLDAKTKLSCATTCVAWAFFFRFAPLGPTPLPTAWILAIQHSMWSGGLFVLTTDLFKKLFFLLSLPPLTQHNATPDMVARAHLRINCGHVRLIEVVEKKLVVRLMTGMSKTKRHDLTIALDHPTVAVLPPPNCDCVNSATKDPQWWCVHKVLVVELFSRIYTGWENIVISPTMTKLFGGNDFLNLSNVAATAMAQQHLRNHIEKKFASEISQSKGHFLHTLPKLRSQHVANYQIYVHPYQELASAIGNQIPMGPSQAARVKLQAKVNKMVKKHSKLLISAQIAPLVTKSGRAIKKRKHDDDEGYK